MNLRGTLTSMSRQFRLFVAVFVIVLNVGFFTGFNFVRVTTSLDSDGIEQNYLGNEDDEDAEVMKFKKSDREMLTIVHTHILSMSMIFFLLGILVWMTDISKRLKLFLTVEPFLSVILTFGGIYFLWNGVVWMKYVVIFSGMLMTLTFVVSSFVVLYKLTQKSAPVH